MNFLNGSIHHQDPQRKDENALGSPAFVGCEHSGDVNQGRDANPIGFGLTEADYKALEGRWIDRRLAERARLRRVDSLTGGEAIGRKSGNYAAILIPYFHPASDCVREYRLRRDQPDLEYDSAGTLKERQRYLSAPGRPNMLYLPPGTGHSFLHETVVLSLDAPYRVHTSAVTQSRGKTCLGACFLRHSVGLVHWQSTY